MHFDSTVSLGNLLTIGGFAIAALFAWRDLSWRIGNMEQWRKEHMIDSDARDALIRKLDKLMAHVAWQTDFMMGRKGQPPPPKIGPSLD